MISLILDLEIDPLARPTRAFRREQVRYRDLQGVFALWHFRAEAEKAEIVDARPVRMRREIGRHRFEGRHKLAVVIKIDLYGQRRFVEGFVSSRIIKRVCISEYAAAAKSSNSRHRIG